MLNEPIRFKNNTNNTISFPVGAKNALFKVAEHSF